MVLIEIYEGDDLNTAIELDDVDAVKRIYKYILSNDETVKLFIHALICGSLDVAEYLSTLTKLDRNDYRQGLFQDISDSTIDWIYSKVKFTAIFRYAYKLARDKHDDYPRYGDLVFILDHVYEDD